MMTRKPRGFRLIEVQASHRLTRSMQRLRFVGHDLDHFATEENLHVRLHLGSFWRQVRSLRACRPC